MYSIIKVNVIFNCSHSWKKIYLNLSHEDNYFILLEFGKFVIHATYMQVSRKKPLMCMYKDVLAHRHVHTLTYRHTSFQSFFFAV